MSVTLETLTTDPSGSENGLIVRNIPSGVQQISADGYLTIQSITNLERTIKTFTANSVLGTGSETMVSLVPSSNFITSGSATSFSVTSGKKLRLQIFSAVTNKDLNSGSVVKLKVSNSGTVNTSSLTIATLDLSHNFPSLLVSISFPDGLDLSDNMQFGVSHNANDDTKGVDISVIGYEY